MVSSDVSSCNRMSEAETGRQWTSNQESCPCEWSGPACRKSETAERDVLQSQGTSLSSGDIPKLTLASHRHNGLFQGRPGESSEHPFRKMAASQWVKVPEQHLWQQSQTRWDGSTPWDSSLIGERNFRGANFTAAEKLCPNKNSKTVYTHVGKSTGVGCHFLPRRIFPTWGSNPDLLHCKQNLYWLNYQGSPPCLWSIEQIIYLCLLYLFLSH